MKRMTVPQIEYLIEACLKGFALKARKCLVEIALSHGCRLQRGGHASLPLWLREKIKEDLVHTYDVPPERFVAAIPDVPAMRAGTRAAQLLRQGDEKRGADPVSRDHVFLKTLTGGKVSLNGMTFDTLPWSYATMQEDRIFETNAQGILLIENLEVFRDFEALNFPVPLCLKNHLIVFRGQKDTAGVGTSRNLIERLSLPVTVFPDFDPAGLSIAQSTPHFAGLLWPGRDMLQAHLRRVGRRDLFSKQLGQFGQGLRRSSGIISEVWNILDEEGRGVVQEHFVIRG